MSLIGQSETVIKVSSDRCFLSKRIGSSKASVTKLSYQQLHYKISFSFIILTRFTFVSYKVPSYVLRWYVTQYGTLTYILFLFLSSFPLSRCAKARRKRLTQLEVYVYKAHRSFCLHHNKQCVWYMVVKPKSSGKILQYRLYIFK